MAGFTENHPKLSEFFSNIAAATCFASVGMSALLLLPLPAELLLTDNYSTSRQCQVDISAERPCSKAELTALSQMKSSEGDFALAEMGLFFAMALAITACTLAPAAPQNEPAIKTARAPRQPL